MLFSAGLMCLALAGGIWYSSRGDAVEMDRRSWDQPCGCLSCSARYLTHVNLSDPRPWTCEKCGKPTAWPLKKCNDCKLVFVPAPIEPSAGADEPSRAPAMPACPKCGGVNSVGAALKEDVS